MARADVSSGGTSEPPQPPAREDRVTITPGLRLHYVEFGPPDGSPILFLHGWPDSWFSFSRVLPLLPPGLRVIAIDQRGFGDSDRPESGYAIRTLATDVLAVLANLGIERATLVGHSLGSFVARQVAVTDPHRVAALVLIGTGLGTRNAVMLEVQDALRELPDPIPEAFARDFQASTVHHPIPPAFLDRLVAESLKLAPRLWPLIWDQLLAYDDADQLAGIRAPTLLVWGDHDALFPRSDQEQLLAVVPGAALSVYADTGHCPNWERPERVATDIAAFLPLG